jgi:hypothetical protein
MTLCNEILSLAIHFCLYLEMEIDLTFCFSLNFDDVVQRNLAFKCFQHEILQITNNQRTKILARVAVDSFMILFYSYRKITYFAACKKPDTTSSNSLAVLCEVQIKRNKTYWYSLELTLPMNSPESEDEDLYPPGLSMRPYCLNHKPNSAIAHFSTNLSKIGKWCSLQRGKPCLDAPELQLAACTALRVYSATSLLFPKSEPKHSYAFIYRTKPLILPFFPFFFLYSPGSLSSIISLSLFLGFPVPVTGRNGKPKPLVLKERGTSFLPPPPVSLEHPHTSGGSQATGCQIGGGDNAWGSGVLGSSRSSDISLSSEVSSLELSFRKSRIAAWEGL